MTRSRPHRPSAGRSSIVRAVVVAALAALTALGTASPAAAQVGGPIGPDDPSTTRPSDDPDRPDDSADPDDDGDDGDDGGGAATTAPDDGSDAPADDGSDEPDAADDEDAEVEGESAAARNQDDDDSGVSTVGLIALVGAGFLLGAALVGGPLWIALSRRRGQASPAAQPPAQPLAPPPTVNPAPVGGTVIVPSARELAALRAQRDGLVEALIGLRDRLPSQALADEAAAALSAAGVEEVRPAGLPFDPSQHRAVGQVEGDGSGGAARVAEVERPGYRDGDKTLRLPDVLVTGQEEGT